MDWNQLLLFAILGLGTGALIAGIALGIVLTYRGSGFINLATGAIAMLGGYSYWSLKTGEYGWYASTAAALVLTFLFLVALGVLIELVAFRPLRTASPLAKLAASLGVLLVAQAGVALAFGIDTKPQPPVLPRDTIKLLGSIVPVDRLILPAIVVGVALALSLLFQLSRFGLATRAASENEVGAMLLGLSPNQLALTNTVLATVIAGGLGVLAASITQLDSTSLPLQVVPALTAALFARFTSFWIAAIVGPRDRDAREHPVLPPDLQLVPDRQRRGAAGRAAAARLRADGRGDVRPRHEPAEPRRARRAAASAGPARRRSCGEPR